MKKYISISFLGILAFSFASCDKKKEETAKSEIVTESKLIDRAEWLLGRWETKMDKRQLLENWEKVNDSVFKGYSIAIENNDTVFEESIVLEQRKGELYYIVSVPGQNQEKPVGFKMSLSRNDELRFENPKHDYPGRIVYINPTPDSLVATISGYGGEKSQTFKMIRKK